MTAWRRICRGSVIGLQRGSFFPWATDRVWQITYPVNMQLQMFWTVLFLGTDRIVEIVQWLGALAAMLAVFGLARLLGASRAQALFAGLVWATFPEIVLEATTTQNDLVAGTLFAAMLYLFFLGLAKQNNGALVLSGVALALGMGTKQTLFFLIPGLGMAVLLALLLSAQGERKDTSAQSVYLGGERGCGVSAPRGVYVCGQPGEFWTPDGARDRRDQPDRRANQPVTEGEPAV